MAALAPPNQTESDELQAVAARLRGDGALEGWRVRGGERAFWLEYSPVDVAARDAGTKIHVSSGIGCAAEVLSRCAPILLRRRVAFKHAADLRRLSFLSSGRGGPSQVGKFITAYPADDDAGRDLAQELHEATRGFHGPRIPHEQPYAEGSIVFSRYGAFVQRWLQLSSGRIVPALQTRGELRTDERGERASAEARLLRDKYVRVRLLFHSPKGSTHLGFEAGAGDDGRLVIIKEAHAHTMEDLRGVDARQRLRDEFRCLTDIEATGIAPVAIDYWETPDSAFLVYEPIEGATVTSVLADLAGHGLSPSAELLRSWGTLLCATVERLHRCAYVSCDIKPSNLVMTADRLFIIDLELAGRPTDDPTGGMGTQGYSSPQQVSHRAGRSVADDVYAIGATLLAMATLSDASTLPNPRAVARLEARRNPGNPAYAVIERCVDDDADHRFASAGAVAAELANEGPQAPAAPTPEMSYLDLATEIGCRILESAVSTSDRHSHWLSNHSAMNGQAARDLYCGSAGIALYLCALYGETGRQEFLTEALRCGAWLWESEPAVPRRVAMPGLYYGECGAALLYLKLYLLSHDAEWLERARAVAGAVRPGEIASPDLMTGLAGVGLFQLMLWEAAGDEQALERARACAGELIDRRLTDRPMWVFPDDFDLFGGSQYPGFAHGSAGIGYFLAECFLATADPDVATLCQEIADWLVDLAEPALPDGNGFTWRVSSAGTGPYMCSWCHGAPGMARFLLLAHRVSSDNSHLDAARRAAAMVARGASWAGTSQCHGLAGNLDVLMDLFRDTGDRHFHVAAQELGQNLRTYETPVGWQSDELATGCVDLMVGEAGVGAAFLRLANPRTPHLISCPAFRTGRDKGRLA